MKRLHGIVVLLLCVLFLTGCGGSHGKVSGTVNYNSKPVAAGTVIFYVEGSQPVSADIVDGRYEAFEVPVGDAMISVTVAAPADPEAVKAKKPKGDKAPQLPKTPPPSEGFPSKYGDPSTSNLRFTIVKGDNTFHIPLSD
jgi:hypothetical protein